MLFEVGIWSGGGEGGSPQFFIFFLPRCCFHSKFLIGHGCYEMLSRVLLHVVKPAYPVQLDVHLGPWVQGAIRNVHSLGPLTDHSLHNDTIDCTIVIRLEMR